MWALSNAIPLFHFQRLGAAVSCNFLSLANTTVSPLVFVIHLQQIPVLNSSLCEVHGVYSVSVIKSQMLQDFLSGVRHTYFNIVKDKTNDVN